MNTDNTFPLSLDFEGKHYHGRIIPSEELGKNGMPVYFRVTLDGEFFAYICCADTGWMEREGHNKPKALVNAIGAYIMDFYE
jgi:hypothetical protein